MWWLAGENRRVTNKLLQSNKDKRFISLQTFLSFLHGTNRKDLEMSPLPVLSRNTWHWGLGERRTSPGRPLWSIFSTTEVHSYSEEDCHQNSAPERRVGSLWIWHKLGFGETEGPAGFSSACWTSCLACGGKLWSARQGMHERRDTDIRSIVIYSVAHKPDGAPLHYLSSHAAFSVYLPGKLMQVGEDSLRDIFYEIMIHI